MLQVFVVSKYVVSYFQFLGLMFMLCTCYMQHMKTPFASRSLHSHGALGASKLFLVDSELCVAIIYTIFGRIPSPTVVKGTGLCSISGHWCLSLHWISTALRQLLFSRELCGSCCLMWIRKGTILRALPFPSHRCSTIQLSVNGQDNLFLNTVLSLNSLSKVFTWFSTQKDHDLHIRLL